MTPEITGTFAARRRKLWGGFYSVLNARCDVELSTGERLVLGHEGSGRRRVYWLARTDGTPLARSQRVHTTGWRSFVNESVRFTAPDGSVLMDLTGWLFPTRLRFGDTLVPCRTFIRRWFRSILGSEFFEIEQKGFDTVRFLVKDPRFLVPTLCFGYYMFVNHSDNSSGGG